MSLLSVDHSRSEDESHGNALGHCNRLLRGRTRKRHLDEKIHEGISSSINSLDLFEMWHGFCLTICTIQICTASSRLGEANRGFLIQQAQWLERTCPA